jgi:23S rRNA pseudouridine2605 synthase
VTVRGRVDAAGLPEGTVLRKASGRESHLTVELLEGKNREVRRMFAALGHEVTRLKRVSLGGLTLGDLEPGRWRELTRTEVLHAFPGAPIRRAARPTV